MSAPFKPRALGKGTISSLGRSHPRVSPLALVLLAGAIAGACGEIDCKESRTCSPVNGDARGQSDDPSQAGAAGSPASVGPESDAPEDPPEEPSDDVPKNQPEETGVSLG